MPFHLLVLTLDGLEQIEVEGRRDLVQIGGSYLIEAGSVATIGAPLGNRPVFVHFDHAWDGRADERARWWWNRDPLGTTMPPPQPPLAAAYGRRFAVRPSSAVAALLRRRLPGIVACWQRGDAWSVASAENGLEALLLAWAAAGDERTQPDVDRQIARAESVARQRIDEAFGVEAFAAAAGLSRSRFHDLYVRLRGEAPGAFLTRARLEAAQALLARGAGLAEAATACGFTDRTAFSRFFARSTGHPPARWRLLQRQPVSRGILTGAR